MVEGDQDGLAGAPEGGAAQQPQSMKMHPAATKQLTNPGDELAGHRKAQQNILAVFAKKMNNLIGMAEKMQPYTAVSAYDVARGGNRVGDPNDQRGQYQSPFGQGQEEPEAMAAAFGQTPQANTQAAAAAARSASVQQRMAQKAAARKQQAKQAQGQV